MRAWVWVLFFFSGAVGLIYEVLWTRALGLVFGNTVESLTAVLTAFMFGLALGGALAGKWAVRCRRPLLVYGVLEILIGIWCAFLPDMISAMTPQFASLYAEGQGPILPYARFGVCLLLLLPPTACMGATLPLLSQHLVRSAEGLSRTAGALYAVNTLGAVFGATAAGFVLLPIFGKNMTNSTAVIANLALGLIAFLLGLFANKIPETTKPTEAPKTSPTNNTARDKPLASPTAFNVALLAFFFTGFAGMTSQVGWTRVLTLAMGSSTYAFSLIVAIFILGLGLGGALGARLAPKLKDPVAALGGVLSACGVSCAVLSALMGWTPLLFFFLLAWGGAGGSFAPLLLLQALGIAAVLLIPTTLMGLSLPFMLRVASPHSQNPGRTVGSIYALNTMGAVFGSLLAGLVLIPWLRLQPTLDFAALLYALPGVTLLCLSASARTRGTVLGVATTAAAMIAILTAAPPWDRRVLNCGAYLLRDAQRVQAAREYRWADALPPLPPENRVLYHKEGASAVVAVVRTQRDLALIIGGKPDASSRSDMATQVGLGLLPMLFHEGKVEDALVIGLGSGVTIGALLSDPNVRQADVVECAPEVAEAATHFAPYSGLRFSGTPSRPFDRRLNLIFNDGRNHLLLTAKKYDVISAEPSNPWIAGIGSLFTREAFQLARSRLKPGGVMCQWLQSYQLDRDDFLSVVRTFTAVFPYATLWAVHPGSDYLLFGSEKPLRMRTAALRDSLENPAPAVFLRRVGLDRVERLPAGFIAADAQLRASAAAAVLHTDDNMHLEFNAPRALFLGATRVTADLWRSEPTDVLNDPEALDAKQLQGLLTAVRVRGLIEDAMLYPERRDKALREAHRLYPELPWCREAAEEAFRLAADDLIHGRPVANSAWLDAEGREKPVTGKSALAGLIRLLETIPPAPADEPWEAVEREILAAAAALRTALDAGDHDEADKQRQRWESFMQAWSRRPPNTEWEKEAFNGHRERLARMLK